MSEQSILKGGIAMEEIKDNIIKDAYYLIKLFNDAKIPVTQLHVQKLMFLFEAYYMNIVGQPLYECNYQAWNFGPVAPQLYKRFKEYGSNAIVLTDVELKEAESIDDFKKKLMKQLFDAFKTLSAADLVKFTHAEGSPWKEAWDEKEYSTISKEKMKDWFSKYVIKQ